MIGQSPASIATAQTFPDRPFKKLYLRLVGADGNTAAIKFKETASATKADILLVHGDDTICLEGDGFTKGSDISVVALAGTPSLYWLMI